jgi:diguanylate cyclase (GGDEF)-like protein
MRAGRRDQPLAVPMLDLDHFKQLNDAFGHGAGDMVLARFGELLRAKCRTEDIACRYGGEEFTAILLETDLDSARQRAEEIRVETSRLEMIQRGQRIGPLSVSIGVAVFPRHARTSQELLAAADAALYRAKHGGRNQVQSAA